MVRQAKLKVLPCAGRFPWLLAERLISFLRFTSICVKSSKDSLAWNDSAFGVFCDGVFTRPGGFGASDFVLRVRPLLFKSLAMDRSLTPCPNLAPPTENLCLSKDVTETETARVLSEFKVGVAGAGGLLLFVLRGPFSCFWFL